VLPWIITHTTWCTSEHPEAMSHGPGCLCTGLQICRFLQRNIALMQLSLTNPQKNLGQAPAHATCLHPAPKEKNISGAAIACSRASYCCTTRHSTTQHRTAEHDSMSVPARSSPVIPEAVQLRSGTNPREAYTSVRWCHACGGRPQPPQLRALPSSSKLYALVRAHRQGPSSGPIVTLSLLFASWAHALESDLHSADVCVRIYIHIRES